MVGCPSSHRLGNTWWYRNTADVRAILHRCYSLLLVLCMPITYRWARNRRGYSIGAAVGTIGTILFTLPLLWTGLATHWIWKAVEEGNFKKLYAVDWSLPLDLSLHLLSFQQWLSPNTVLWIDLMKQYLPMDGYWMKALFTRSVLFSHVSVLPSCWNKLLQEATDFIPFFVGFTCA